MYYSSEFECKLNGLECLLTRKLKIFPDLTCQFIQFLQKNLQTKLLSHNDLLVLQSQLLKTSRVINYDFGLRDRCNGYYNQMVVQLSCALVVNLIFIHKQHGNIYFKIVPIKSTNYIFTTQNINRIHMNCSFQCN